MAIKTVLTLRDLIQAQLDGDTVQYYSAAEKEWIDFHETLSTNIEHLDNAVNKDIYRIKPTKPSIDWSQVSDKYNYLARYRDGFAYLYQRKPRLGLTTWRGSAEGGASALTHKSYKPGNCDWTESLVERPKGV